MRVRKRNQSGHGYNVIPAPYELEGPRISECPVSYITPRSIELVQIVSTMRHTSPATIDLAELPGAIVDALRLADIETSIQEAAMNEAVENC